MIGEPENQFHVTRAARIAGRCAIQHNCLPFAVLLAICILFFALDLGCCRAASRDSATLQKVWDTAVANGFSGGAMVIAGTNTLLFEVRSSAHSNQFVLRKDTPLPICSVTKAMTAKIVFDLIDERKLALEGTLKIYRPWIPVFAENITLRQLLTHTSGLRNMDQALGVDANGVSRIYLTFDASLQPLQSRILRVVGDRATAPAGTKYDYNNADFLLLQAVAERVSGRAFDELLLHHVFRPAGMPGSSLASWDSAGAFMVDCYAVEGEKETSLDRFNMAIYGGAGGVVSTPDDLVKWLKYMLLPAGGRPLLLSGSQFGGFQGFGGYASRSTLVRKKLALPGDEAVYERPGAINGYTLQVSFLPERGLAAAAFSNRAGQKLGSVYEGSGLVAELLTAACQGLSEAPTR